MQPIKLEDIGLGFAEEEAAEEVLERPLLERIGARVFLLFAFLLPLFFIPSASFPLPAAKAALIYLSILAVFSFWVIARLKDGQFLIPQTRLLAALGIFLLVAALSGIFSSSLTQSFVGQGTEVGTVVNMLLLSLAVFLIPVLLRAKDQIFGMYLAFFLSFFVLALFHLLRFLFGPDFLSFSILTDAVSNTVGKWNDLAIFFGAGALLSLITLELLSLNRLFRILAYVALVVSLFFLAIINFVEAWWVLGIFSLVFLVYRVSVKDVAHEAVSDGLELRPERRRLPVAALIVVFLSVVFIIWGAVLGGRISGVMKIPQQLEARPSWQTTFSVSRETLKSDPLFGAGPGAFVGEWLKWKPAAINSTVFWNVDFNYGVGLIPTFLATLGILGTLAWLLFFCVFCYAGFKAILAEHEDGFSQYLVTSSFLTALFFWVFAIIYIPSQTIFALTFLFTGLFLAALVSERFVPLRLIPFIERPKAGFVSVLLLILFLIGGLTLAYALSKRYVSAWYFERGVRAAGVAGDIDGAQKLVTQAAEANKSDIYYRALTEIGLVRMGALLSRDPGDAVEQLRTEFRNLFGETLGNAREAVAIHPENYQNLVELGRVYESVVPLKIDGAYENARKAYEDALTQNPKSPALHLTLARLEMARGANTAAREEIARALKEKPNYTEAIFFLSQIEALEGNIKAAIASVETASVLAPTDPTVFFQLGLLRYNDRNYRGAIEALERAVALNPAYANAKYFLGLSYDKVGRDADAIAQFTDLKATNPDNKEVDLILRNLKAGRAPFADAAPPIDAKPEKRGKLPVPEKVKAAEEE